MNKILKTILFTGILGAVFFIIPTNASAANYYHDGIGSLSDANSWWNEADFGDIFGLNGTLPVEGDTGVIQSGITVTIEDTVTFDYALDIESGGILNVESGGILNVNSNTGLNVKSGGALNVRSGGILNVNFAGSLAINGGGSLNVNSDGTLNVNSDGTLSINSGGTLTIDCFGNFNLNSGGTLSSEGTFEYANFNNSGTFNELGLGTSTDISASCDITPPVISSIASSTIQTTAQITWTTTGDSSDSKVSYGTVTNTYTTSTSSPTLVTSHSLGLISLTASTQYFFVVVSRDLAGNISTSTENTLLTTAPPDTTSPIISELTPIGTVTDTTPSYTFTTSEAGTISYGGSCTSATTEAVINENTITLDTLVVGTYTDCTITVTDSASNVSNTLTLTSFTITAPSAEPDPEPAQSSGTTSGSSPSRSTTNTSPNTPSDPPCSNGALFNTNTGLPCSVSTPAEVPGCLPGFNFSTLTGKSCKTDVTTPATPNTPTTYKFLKNIPFGTIRSEDVRQLQIFLNTNGFPVATTGVGSPGYETRYFGPATRSALARFQASVGITPSVGFFGLVTREYINGI